MQAVALIFCANCAASISAEPPRSPSEDLQPAVGFATAGGAKVVPTLTFQFIDSECSPKCQRKSMTLSVSGRMSQPITDRIVKTIDDWATRVEPKSPQITATCVSGAKQEQKNTEKCSAMLSDIKSKIHEAHPNFKVKLVSS